jgi:hypothetical protein
VHIENLDKLIAHMERVPDELFDMSNWLALKDMPSGSWSSSLIGARTNALAQDQQPCGTACCIAGEAWFAMPKEDRMWLSPDTPRVSQSAEAWLGLTEDEAQHLFIPDSEASGWPLHALSREAAIAVLRHLRETGEVDWGRFEDLSQVERRNPESPSHGTAIGG